MGLNKTEIDNECTGEKWIFGNIPYPHKKTFVISVIDTTEKVLKIANVIFNAKSQMINGAVTTNKMKVNKEAISKEIEKIVDQVFKQKVFPLEPIKFSLEKAVEKPETIFNLVSDDFSHQNIYMLEMRQVRAPLLQD